MRYLVPGVLLAAMCAATGAAQECAVKELKAERLSVRSVHVEGGPLGPRAEAVIRSVLHNPTHLEGCQLSVDELRERMRRVYQNHGYFKAEVAGPEIKPVGSRRADLVFTVDPGSVYRLSTIEFTNVTAFPIEQLRAVFPVRSGELFKFDPVSNGLDKVRELYVSKGYIHVTWIPEPQVDDATRTIRLVIHIDEGRVFTIGPLALDGTEPAAGVGKKLLAAWQSLMGKPYDPGALNRFLRENAALLRIQHPEADRLLELNVDQQTRIISVLLRFPD